MKQLTENQINFLLKYFFKAEEFAGWKNIATKLLNTGSCIVAGKNCIWRGGIGNFIKTKNAENAFDCLLYEFDLDYFLTSKWYLEVKNEYVATLVNEKLQIEDQINEINNL